jgi:hypothetical protein
MNISQQKLRSEKFDGYDDDNNNNNNNNNKQPAVLIIPRPKITDLL